jgi:hypothetical protein
MLKLGINATTGDETFATRALDNPGFSGHENMVGEFRAKGNPVIMRDYEFK